MNPRVDLPAFGTTCSYWIKRAQNAGGFESLFPGATFDSDDVGLAVHDALALDDFRKNQIHVSTTMAITTKFTLAVVDLVRADPFGDLEGPIIELISEYRGQIIEAYEERDADAAKLKTSKAKAA